MELGLDFLCIMVKAAAEFEVGLGRRPTKKAVFGSSSYRAGFSSGCAY